MSDQTDVVIASREFLRHALATLAYRAEKVLRDPPAQFADLRVSPMSRSPLEIVGHLADLMEWGTRLAEGEYTWSAGPMDDWLSVRDRFFRGLSAFDAALERSTFEKHSAGVIFQAPVADALTHVGQLALLRGVAGAPVRPESYARAEIRAGRVGAEQSSVRKEFDGDASRRS
jgi:hypothetical protein